jgi:hypothetical protein
MTTGRAEESASACQSEAEFELVPGLGVDRFAVLSGKGESARLASPARLEGHVLEPIEVAFDEGFAVDAGSFHTDDGCELRTPVPEVDLHVDMEGRSLS